MLLEELLIEKKSMRASGIKIKEIPGVRRIVNNVSVHDLLAFLQKEY